VSTLSVRLVGGPTAIVEYAGMRWLTDPAFSPPGQYGALVKTTGPAIAVDQLGSVTVTAVPALHGPPGGAEITGPVIGFVLSGEDLQTVYISGDNASLDVVREIAQRVGPVDVGVLFAGAVQIASRFDGAYLTLSSDRAAEAALILQARVVIPVHFEGWTHFTQGADELRAAFHGYGVADRLRLLGRGETVEA
jgi:L-ascorbate metabolism protein UlaG (beta-lactamase superfamily)